MEQTFRREVDLTLGVAGVRCESSGLLWCRLARYHWLVGFRLLLAADMTTTGGAGSYTITFMPSALPLECYLEDGATSMLKAGSQLPTLVAPKSRGSPAERHVHSHRR